MRADGLHGSCDEVECRVKLRQVIQIVELQPRQQSDPERERLLKSGVTPFRAARWTDGAFAAAQLTSVSSLVRLEDPQKLEHSSRP